MILTLVIMALFGLFWIAEIIAHLTLYRYGRTLSAIIWALEAQRRYGLAVRVIVGVLVAALFTHLEFRVP